MAPFRPKMLETPAEDPTPDEHLMLAYLRGSPDALATLFARYRQPLYGFFRRRLPDPAHAEELTQDTFLRAWSARASFRNECAIHTWLMHIAINLLRDHTRTERFRFWKRASTNSVDASDPSLTLTQPGSSVESRLIASEQMALVWNTVAQLSARQRHVFILRFVEELELSEIAVITNLPISTVKSHLYRALATIRNRHNSATQESL